MARVAARPAPPPEDDVEQAVLALRAGEAIVVPTDTLYGLAALPTVPGAVDRLFSLKGRPADTPIAVLVAGIEQVEALADLSGTARRLADAFWPGPLTMVLPRRAGVDLPLGEPHATIGVRWPDHPVIAALGHNVSVGGIHPAVPVPSTWSDTSRVSGRPPERPSGARRPNTRAGPT